MGIAHGRSEARREASRGVRRPDLARAVDRVVTADNCSGCGACTLLSPALHMRLDTRGFLRPVWDGPDRSSPPEAARTFDRICPGVRVNAVATTTRRHPTFGPYVSSWAAWSADPATRFAGSSGGVLTALASWLLATGRASTVIGTSTTRPGSTRSSAQRLLSPSEVLAAAGSRYAPTANAALFEPDADSIFIGKPCEVSAVRQLSAVGPPGGPVPVLLSFFCAGVPSQVATDKLVTDLGLVAADVQELRYRGNGWPGDFTAVDSTGSRVRASYEKSWGLHLGKQIQDRCKICPDGTGSHADISVGDYWDADAAGYPVFTEGGGRSAAIARNPRGHALLMEARDAGVLVLEAVDISRVVAMQPLQDQRVRTLAGRLAGRKLAGRRVPRFRGFGLWCLAAAAPRQTLRYLRGSYTRSKRSGS